MKPNSLPVLTALLATLLFVDIGRSQTNPPTILTQPQSVFATNGATVRFAVTATGTQPLYYHWQFNGVNLTNSRNIIDATASGVTLYQVAASNAGPYDVVITNVWGAVTSSVALLTIGQPPVIATQPVSQVYSNHNPIAFTVAATGAGPITYQWLFNGRYLPNNVIGTLAGTNGPGILPGVSIATNTSLNHPFSVAVDEEGDVFIADTYNNRIRKVTTNGLISTVVGNGSEGYSGNGGTATNSSLNYPSGVALDGDDNVFIADRLNERVRVETYGILITVAGNGQIGATGDGAAAVNATLYQPSGIAVDADGNIFIADTDNSRIRKVDVNDVITTVAGNGTKGYSGDGGAATNANLYLPSGVVVDAYGNLFIADTFNNRIRKVDTNGIITTVAGDAGGGYSGDGRAATNSTLAYPSGVAVDAYGNLLIADTSNNRIRRVGANGLITTVAGNGVEGFSGDGGAATNAWLNQPDGVAVDASGDLFIADSENNRVRKVTVSGPVLTVANPGQTNAGNYQVIVSNIFGSVTSSIATLTVDLPPLITRQPSSETEVIGAMAAFSAAAIGTPALTWQWQFAGTNLTDGAEISGSTTANLIVGQLAPNNGGPYDVIVSDAWGSVTSSVAVLTIAYPPAITNQPVSLTVVNGGNAVFSVAATGTPPLSYVWSFNGTNLPDGLINTVVGNGLLDSPSGVTFDAHGNLFIADTLHEYIYKMDTNGNLVTVAGNGTAGFSSDGGAATNVALDNPFGLAVDAAGNVFFAENAGDRIRKVDVHGIISTVAGSGLEGFSGDGGAATNAGMDLPAAVVVDSTGNVYFADSSDQRIRKVDTNGIITTVAGNGTAGFAGDGGLATQASLYYPEGLALDAAGELFIADTSNQRVRKVDTNGIITTVAGNGGTADSGDGGLAVNASVDDPFAVAVDVYGDLFIADTGHDSIRKVDAMGYISTVAGDGTSGYTGDGGPAVAATLLMPFALTADPVGNLFIADTGNNALREVTLSAGYPNLILNNVTSANAGTYQVMVYNPWAGVTSSIVTLNVVFTPAITNQPAAQTVINGGSAAFSVAATGTGPLTYQWQFDGANLPNGIIATVAGNGTVGFSGDGGAATNSHLSTPSAVAVDGFGNLFIADTSNQRVRRVDVNGHITTVAGNGGNGYLGNGGAATNASLYFPSGVAVDADGNLFIADSLNQRIRRVDTNGFITSVAGNGSAGYAGDGGAATNASLNYPSGVAVDASCNLFIADMDNQCIRKVDVTGLITTVAGNGTNSYSGDGGAATNATLNSPAGVAVDARGNLFIADTDNNRIRRVDADGLITTVAGTGYTGWFGDGGAATNATLYYPKGVAVDGSGNLLIADTCNQRIRRVDTNGIIATMAGDGTNAWSGDGGLATAGALSYPYGVAADAQGNFYIADRGNNRVRRVVIDGPTLAMGDVTAANAGIYQVIITSAWGSVTSAVAALNVAYPPAITNQPVSQTVVDGRNVTFTVVVAGTPPFSCQWQFNGTNLSDGGNLSGSATASLVLDPVATANAGGYDVVVTSAWGSVTSSVAALNVAYPPAITNQPVNLSSLAGNNVVLGVGVNGTLPLAYQWQFDGTNLPNGVIYTIAGNGSAGFSNGTNAVSLATNTPLNWPYGVAVDAHGNRFIADMDNQRIRMVNANGVITTVAGTGASGYSGDGGSATNAMISYPTGVAVDANGNIFIADTDNQRIRMVNASGIITTVAGKGGSGYSGDGGAATNASLYNPYAVAVDASSNLFIADRSNDRVRMVNARGIITTVAGRGVPGFSGDGGAATDAELYFPSGVTVDASGNLFVADQYNQRIREVTPNGVITSVGGTGVESYSGDGGPATNAPLNMPAGVAVDAQGNLFISDRGNERVRKVDASGIITTVAGKGLATYSGDGGPATNASLFFPGGVATDPYGDLFIADTENQRIREVVLQGPILPLSDVTAANGGSYQVIVTNLYGSVTSSVAVLTVEIPPVISQQPVNETANIGSNATFSVTATGTGPVSYQWQFNGVSLPQGNYSGAAAPTLTIIGTTAANGGNYDVVITNDYGSVTSTVVTLTIAYPPAITLQPASQVLTNSGTVTFNVGASGTGPFTYQWKFNGTNLPNNIITTVAGNGTNRYSGDGGAATNAGLYSPAGVAVDAEGNLFIADTYDQRIRKVNSRGIITTVVGSGNEGYNGNGLAATNSSLYLPAGVAVDADDNLLIADTGNNRIREETYGLLITVAGGEGTLGGDGGPAINAGINQPAAVAIDGNGNLFIADRDNSRIRKVDVNDTITTLAGKSVVGYAGDGGVATNAELNNPYGVAVDATGNVFIADTYNQRVRKVDANGIITTVAGTGTAGFSGDGGAATNATLHYPYGLATDAYGDLFIADYYNQRIRKLAPNGIITTVAGNGTNYLAQHPLFSGDGGPATNATFADPYCVAVDASGDLYIADTYNYRIRKVTPQGPALTLANAGLANAGNYQVVITSPYGSVTSSVVTLTVDVGPAITQQPMGQTIIGGGQAIFSVTATGTPTLAYQWQFSGVPQNDGGKPNFSLDLVSPANAGPYQVVITNLYGSVTSSLAALAVTLPQISLVPGANGGVTLNLLTAPNASTRILMATNLTPPVVWQPIYRNTVGTNGVWQFTDTNTSASPVRFYRSATP